LVFKSNASIFFNCTLKQMPKIDLFTKNRKHKISRIHAKGNFKVSYVEYDSFAF